MEEYYTYAMESRFSPAKKNLPYSGDTEYTGDIMSLVSLYLLNAVSYKSACNERLKDDDILPNLPGIAMSFDEAMCHGASYPFHRFSFEYWTEAAELLTLSQEHIDSRLTVSHNAGVYLRIERLRELFELSDFSFFCFICSLAFALDRGFERLFSELCGNPEIPCPTLGAIQACYGFSHSVTALDARLLNPSSVENRLLFISQNSDKPPLARAMLLQPVILSYIHGERHMSRELLSFSSVIENNCSGEVYFIENRISHLRREVLEMRKRSSARLCVLAGQTGSGKKLSLAKISKEENLEFLVVGLNSQMTEEIINELVSISLLWGTVICFYQDYAVKDDTFTRVLNAFKFFNIGVILITNQLRGNIVHSGYMVSRIDYPRPSLAQSLHFWELFAKKYDTDISIDWAQFAAKYTLTPGQIESALHAAAETVKSDNTPVNVSALDSAILLGNTGRLSEIADRIHVFYKWDDLVLSDTAKQLLRDVCNRIKYRHLVETQWGFGGKSAYGNGVSVLLYGPPGTGKTMSAQVIAGEFGLPLYRINISQIISKYIGETAKNLDTIFTEAKSSNVILFFDEADALFSKRTDIKTSNDKHANSESSYLLQKIEEYSGISILATNLANNFDEAFRRRINYMINISMPSAAQRLKLWQNAFPADAPVLPDVDLKLLADNLEVSGSVIKSAAIQAAYFAAEDSGQIGMAHIAKAAKRELQKLGKSEPHFLTVYK